jgi:hypothetical protein
LQRSLVAADAEWVLHLHLDMASLQKSQLGASLLKIAMDEVGEDLKEDMQIHVPAIVAQIGSITAYGADFKPGPDGRGVLIWQGSKEIEQVVRGCWCSRRRPASLVRAASRRCVKVRTRVMPWAAMFLSPSVPAAAFW